MDRFGLRSIADSLGIESREVLSRMGGVTGQGLIAAMASPRAKDWYRFDNREDDDAATLHIYDEIGWFGTTAGEFVDQLGELDVTKLDVRINSMGGDVFDGIAIYNALRVFEAEVTTFVDSAALSIASVIAQAGDRRVMLSGSQMMIHEAWGLAIGNAVDLRDYADLLDKQTDNIAAIYAEAAGGSGKAKHFRALMAGEKWLSAAEAVDEGLADEVLTPPKRSTATTENRLLPGYEVEAATDALAAFVRSAEIHI